MECDVAIGRGDPAETAGPGCDIKDPTQNMVGVTPEGGGLNYSNR